MILCNVSQSIYNALEEAWFVAAIDYANGTLTLASDTDTNKIFSYSGIIIVSFVSITILIIISKKKLKFAHNA